LLSWAPTADDGQVSALTMTPNGKRVIVGGRFTTLDGQAANGMGALDATSGAIEPWAINTAVKDGDGAASSKCGITNLSTDGTNIYGGGFAFGCGNFEGTFAANPTTGAIVWINDCHGDTYSTLPEGKVLYVASHAHDCTAIGQFPNNSPQGHNQRATAFATASTGGTDVGPDAYGWNYNGDPDTALLHWFPTLAPGTVTGQNQAAWSVTGNANYVAYGGEFPTVNGSAQEGLVRFAVSSIAPNKVGPIAATSATTLVPTVSSTAYGQVSLSWTATWDRDNANLTYTVLRDGAAVGTVTQASNFWQLPTVSYTDKGLTPGTSHTYRIRVTDPSGNSIGSGTSAPVTVSSSGTAPASAAPTASFTSSCSQRTCAFDAAKSTAVDGSVASYAWTFGDGTTGSGATASHTYNGDGKHAVALTVTDSAGSTSAAVSHSVTTTTLVAQDTFAKSVKSGWGTSGVGGSWSRSGCKSMSVSGRHGTLVAARAKDCSTWLPQVKRSSTDTAATLRSPSAPKGGLQAAVIGRRISAADDIRLRLEFQHNGNAVATVLQRVGGKTTALSKSVKVEAASHSNGTFRVLLEVTGTSPTTVRAKVWSSGNSQPAAWTLTAKTGTGALQHKGALGFDTYLAQAHNPKSSSMRVSDFSSSTVG
ncbi:PKD domain-containing protein, partial [Jatrophihabitans endophyticus]|uniref:PKD domain-containing protein n=1 Tax=Jatrophihabitans endophyticus TaxID=1206085 RepID=UPI0019EC1DDC